MGKYENILKTLDEAIATKNSVINAYYEESKKTASHIAELVSENEKLKAENEKLKEENEILNQRVEGLRERLRG